MIKLSLDECTQRIKRRATLSQALQAQYPDKQGILLFFAAYEKQREAFYQDSTFFYYVGIDEPAVVYMQPVDGEAILYEPQFSTKRSVWVSESYDSAYLEHLGIHKRDVLGEALRGYSLELWSSLNHYNCLITMLKEYVNAGKYFFIPLSDAADDCKVIIDRLAKEILGFENYIIDVSDTVANFRRIKDQQELEYMYKAVEITTIAHEAVAGVIKPGKRESDAHAAINYIFTEGNAVSAFASIVGSGSNSTVLHYTANDGVMQQGDLVVVDIGASYKHYCADVSRTYPVSGVFTRRQKEVYDHVLATQEYIAALAKPGMYLNNPDEKEKSLNHLAREYLKKHALDGYLPHSIGHYVGLDVHDVGNVKEPLKIGDIITIEPGVYIPEERLGVRIEDMYWIVEDDAVCLSEHFPKTTIAIEEAMRNVLVRDEEQWSAMEKGERSFLGFDLQA